MKKGLKSIFVACAALAVLATSSCKDETGVVDNTVPATGARVKFYHGSPGAPAINFYANDTKISGSLVTNGVEAGSAYPFLYPSTDYALIRPGQVALKAQIPATATTDANLAIASQTVTLEDGKYYSFFTTDAYNTTTKASGTFFVEDKWTIADPTKAYVRFVHIMPSGTSNVDVVASRTDPATSTVTNTTIFTNRAHKTATDFIAVDAGGSTVFRVRYTGTTTDLTTTTFTPAAGRVYTVFVRGLATATTGTTARTASFYTNY